MHSPKHSPGSLFEILLFVALAAALVSLAQAAPPEPPQQSTKTSVVSGS